MEEKCIDKLKEWFCGCSFEYEIVKSTEDECIFAIMSDDSSERMISLYRIFKLGEGLEISRDYEQNLSGDSISMLSAISELLRVYTRVSV